MAGCMKPSLCLSRLGLRRLELLHWLGGGGPRVQGHRADHVLAAHVPLRGNEHRGAGILFSFIRRSHSISFTGTQVVPKYKIGLGGGKDVCVHHVGIGSSESSLCPQACLLRPETELNVVPGSVWDPWLVRIAPVPVWQWGMAIAESVSVSLLIGVLMIVSAGYGRCLFRRVCLLVAVFLALGQYKHHPNQPFPNSPILSPPNRILYLGIPSALVKLME
jgi:hypothetical protein